MPRSAVVLLLVLAFATRAAAERLEGERRPSGVRVVSLSPSLTAILLALGGRELLVGVDDSSGQFDPRVRSLPQVGGLFNPSVEAIVALAPTTVLLVPSAQQRELRKRLEALGIEVLALANISYDDVLTSIETIGAHFDLLAATRERRDAIRAAWDIACARAAGRPRVRGVLVLQREPLYVVGRGSFLDKMLECAGAENLARRFDDPYPRVSLEWLIAAAPELILDAADPAEGAVAHWAHWPSLPAVKKNRVETLDRAITIPGPYLDRSLADLSARVHDTGQAP